MKMSEVFNLPLEVRNDLVSFSKSDTCFFKVESVKSRKEELFVNAHVQKAVNEYDQHMALIGELTQALSQLVEYTDNLENSVNRMVDNHDVVYSDIPENAIPDATLDEMAELIEKAKAAI